VSDQRFAPPAAVVADVARERVLAQRPRQVVVALVLLWAGVLLGLPIMVFEFAKASASAPAAGMVVVVFFAAMFVVSAILNILIGRGRNWARIAYLLITLWSMYIFLTSLSELFAKPGYEIAFELLDTALDFVVLPLLFFGPGARWFRSVREQD
jgi:uncharacterized membrane protein YuzA (DUF378 family)